jgi:chemotaxis protein histidine kinase CheA
MATAAAAKLEAEQRAGLARKQAESAKLAVEQARLEREEVERLARLEREKAAAQKAEAERQKAALFTTKDGRLQYYRAAIRTIYEEHNPPKLEILDALLAEWSGEEHLLYQHIRDKYNLGPETESEDEDVVEARLSAQSVEAEVASEAAQAARESERVVADAAVAAAAAAAAAAREVTVATAQASAELAQLQTEEARRRLAEQQEAARAAAKARQLAAQQAAQEAAERLEAQQAAAATAAREAAEAARAATEQAAAEAAAADAAANRSPPWIETGFFPSGPHGPLPWMRTSSANAGMRGGCHHVEVAVKLEELGELGAMVGVVGCALAAAAAALCTLLCLCCGRRCVLVSMLCLARCAAPCTCASASVCSIYLFVRACVRKREGVLLECLSVYASTLIDGIHLYIKCIILPRQARDKHRENSKKSAVFPQEPDDGMMLLGAGLASISHPTASVYLQQPGSVTSAAGSSVTTAAA